MTALNALSILLVILTPLSYVPQYRRLHAQHSTRGISIWATFILVLVYQAEIANMYYLFQSAPEKSLPESRFGVPVHTPPILRDWINLAQILVQWACALFLLGLVCYLPVHPPIKSGNGLPSDQDNRSSTKKLVIVMLVIHAALFGLAVFISPRPYGSWDPIFALILGIMFDIVNPLLSLALFLGMMLQILTTCHEGLGSLSTRTVFLKGIVFAGLAFCWPFRLILPRNMWEVRPVQPVVLTTWYPLVGWACVNSVVVAGGSAILLCVAGKSDMEPSSTAERTALLAG